MNKLKVTLVIIAITLLVGGLLAGSIFINRVPENPPGTVGNTGGNHYNNGLFCEDEGQVFFANPYDQNTLYVMNSNESEVKKLTTVGVKSLNAAGKYVYYYQDDVGAGSGLGFAVKTTGIHRMDKKTQKTECLIKVPLLSMNLINNDIYYQHFKDDGMSLDTIAIDKSSESTAIEGIMAPSCAVDGVIYYSHQEDNFLLYAYDTRLGMNSLLWNHKVYNPIYHTDGYIYFIDLETNYELHRYNPMTGEEQTITTDRVENYNMYDSYIYYQKFSETTPALMRMQTDGSNAEVISYGNYTNINITSNFVYYTQYGSPTPMYHQYLWGPVNPSVFSPQIEE